MILSSPHCSLLHIFSEDFFFFKQPHLGQQLTKVYEIFLLCVRSSFPQQQTTKTILRNVLLHLKIKSKSLFYTNITSYVPHLLLSPCFYWCSFQTNFSKHLLSLPFTHLIFPSASLFAFSETSYLPYNLFAYLRRSLHANLAGTMPAGKTAGNR